MITFNDLKRYIASIQHKIFLLLGRGIVAAINNSETTQKIQIKGLSGETITDIERLQEYGLETYPHKDAEALACFLNGKRDNGIILVIGDRRYRLTDLSQGEVALYTDEDSNTDKHRIHLKNNQLIDVLCKILNIDLGTSLIINCPTNSLTGTQLTIICPTINITGDITLTGNLNMTGILDITGSLTCTGNIASSAGSVSDSSGTMQQMRNTYNTHTHPGGGIPNPQM